MDLDKKLKIMENRNTLLEKENKKLKEARDLVEKFEKSEKEKVEKIENKVLNLIAKLDGVLFFVWAFVTIIQLLLK